MAGKVSIELFNGRGICVMHNNDNVQPGNHVIRFDGNNIARGMYYCQLTAGGEKWIGKTLIIK
jgi:hypothetical protein